MRYVFLALVLALTAVAGAAHASPFEPATLPQQVEAAGHVDFDALRSTQLFAALGGQAAIDQGIDKMPGDVRALAAPIVKSIRGISFWHAGEHGAILIETRDARAVATLLSRGPVKAGASVDGMATYTADEKAFDHPHPHHPGGHGDHGFLGAYGDTLVVADSYDSLALSLRTLAGKAPNLAGSRSLTTSTRAGVFVFVTIGDGVLDSLAKTSHSKLMQLGAKSIVVNAGETGGIVSATARAELTSAEALAKAKTIIEGMRAIASLSDEPGAKQLLNGITVTANGNALEINARWPVADLKAVIDHAHENHE